MDSYIIFNVVLFNIHCFEEIRCTYWNKFMTELQIVSIALSCIQIEHIWFCSRKNRACGWKEEAHCNFYSWHINIRHYCMIEHILSAVMDVSQPGKSLHMGKVSYFLLCVVLKTYEGVKGHCWKNTRLQK